MPSKPRKKRGPYKARVDRINNEDNQAFCAHLMSIGMKKGQVKHELRKKLKRAHINPGVIEDVLRGAEAFIVTASGQTEEALKDQNFAFYKGVIVNPKKGDWLKMKAAERIDKLCGLEGPVKVELSGGLAHTAKLAVGLIGDPAIAKILDQLDDTLDEKRSAAEQQRAAAGKK